MIKYIKFIIYGFFIFCLGYLNSTQAAVNPSSEDLRVYPTAAPTEKSLVFARITALLYIVANTSPVFAKPAPPSGYYFVQVTRCPPGTTYVYPTAPIDEVQVYNCFHSKNGGCLPWISKGPIAWPIGYSMNTNVTCSIQLQGWFLAQDIKAFLKANGNTQSAAPINNFNLGTYTVSLYCDMNRPCKCTTTAPNGTTAIDVQIPGYGQICYSGTDENQDFLSS